MDKRDYERMKTELTMIINFLLCSVIVGVSCGFFVGDYLKGISAFFVTFGLIGLIYYGYKLFQHWMKLEKT